MACKVRSKQPINSTAHFILIAPKVKLFVSLNNETSASVSKRFSERLKKIVTKIFAFLVVIAIFFLWGPAMENYRQFIFVGSIMEVVFWVSWMAAISILCTRWFVVILRVLHVLLLITYCSGFCSTVSRNLSGLRLVGCLSSATLIIWGLALFILWLTLPIIR